MHLPYLTYLLFLVLTAVAAAVVIRFLALTSGVQFPRICGNQPKFFDISKGVLYGLDVVPNNFFLVVTFIILFDKLSPKSSSDFEGTFFLKAWHWLSKQQAMLSLRVFSRLLLTLLSKVMESVKSNSIGLIQLLKLLGLDFFWFSNLLMCRLLWRLLLLPLIRNLISFEPWDL